jgi:tetratricopeptide (TPR) repeat protein
MNPYLFFAIVITLLFAGCSKQLSLEPAQMESNIKKLEPNEMRLIYRSIQDEIDSQNEKGDWASEYGYNARAIAAYELVNFYEGRAQIPKSKIDALKHKAKSKSRKHYAIARKYLSKDPKRALKELNTVLKNDPRHKEASVDLALLKRSPSLQGFIASLNETLRSALSYSGYGVKTVTAIGDAMQQLIDYDPQSPLIAPASERLERAHREWNARACEHYGKGEIDKAGKAFGEILSVFNEDRDAKRYLARCKEKMELKAAQKALDMELKAANKALERGDCAKAIELAKALLKRSSDDTEARDVLARAEEECQQKILQMIKVGAKQYFNKDLDGAKKSFEEVLKLDPENSVSLIYSKKIENQLTTIKSLN